MSITPLVSVVIPFYNRIDLLLNTIESVNQQMYKSIEIILIDDCSELIYSQDFFKDYITEFTYKYFRLNANKGPGLARSIGRDLASGVYIAYLDSDDLWKPEFLLKTVKAIEQDKTVGMIFTNVLIKRGDKERLRLNMADGVYDFFNLIFDKGFYWATGASLWRNTISLKENWLPFKDHEDYVHDILSLKHDTKVQFISKPLCVVNKSNTLGTARLNTEMLKSLLFLAHHNEVYSELLNQGRKIHFYSFFISRLHKRRYSALEKISLLKSFPVLLKWQPNFLLIFKDFLKIVIKY